MDYSVLLIGDSQLPEFASVCESLRGRNTIAGRDISAAISVRASGWQEPDLVILLQSWPGEFEPEGYQELRRLAPLARVMTVLGSWCEGETRSGSPLPGTTRLYWHEWPARNALDELQIAAGACPFWGLPVTATEEDRLLWAAEHPDCSSFDNSPGQGAVGILTSQHAMWEWLADACREFGYRSNWLRPDCGDNAGDLSAILWDRYGDPAEELQLARILGAKTKYLPVLALTTFPRAEDQERLGQLGVTALIGKPVRLDELQWRLSAITAPAGICLPPASAGG